jgi:hypothetical protein
MMDAFLVLQWTFEPVLRSEGRRVFGRYTPEFGSGEFDLVISEARILGKTELQALASLGRGKSSAARFPRRIWKGGSACESENILSGCGVGQVI